MAIPIRLILGDGTTSIDLLSTAIDMNISRSTSQYPTPNLAAGRVGIDTNVPEIKIDIQGIFVDEDTPILGDAANTASRAPLITAINFGALLQENKGDVSRVVRNFVFQEVDVEETYNEQCDVDGNETWSTHTVTRTKVGFGNQALQGEFTAERDYPENTITSIVTKKINLHYGPGLKYTGSPDLITSLTSDFTDGWLSTSHTVASTVSSGSSATVTLNPVHPQPGPIGSTSFYYGTHKARITPIHGFIQGDRIVKEDGTFVGIVASSSKSINLDGTVNVAADNKVVFAAAVAATVTAGDVLYKQFSLFDTKGNALGLINSFFWNSDNDTCTITLASNNPFSISTGDSLYVNKVVPIEDRLHGQCIKITPSYWLEDITRSKNRSGIQERNMMISKGNTQGVLFRFDSTSAYTNTPSISNKVKFERGLPGGRVGPNSYNNGDAVITIPIKGFTGTDSPMETLLGRFSAAQTALRLSDLIENNASAPVSSKTKFNVLHPFFAQHEDCLAAMLSLEVTDSILIIKQNYTPDTETTLPNPLSKVLAGMGIEALQTSNYKATGGNLSAGDKAQNLIGLVSNAKGDDLIRGIQIPYDSLITSSSVTGITRNFFLTFGNIDADKKGSVSNSISASAHMASTAFNSVGGTGGQTVEEREGTLLDNIVDAFPGVANTIVNFVVSNARTVWTTLTSESHGNNNGISIIANKLHVRYDAGNNYYAFNLELLASDFVIGV